MNGAVVVHLGKLRLQSANGVHRTIWGLARSQAELGLDTHIISVGRPPDDADLATAGRFGVEVHSAKSESQTAALMAHLLNEQTIVHSHSAFDPTVSRLARLALRHSPLLVRTPNGVVSPGVFRRRPIRKRTYWMLVERPLFNKTALVHAVGEGERSYLHRKGIDRPSFVAPNGIFGEEVLSRKYPQVSSPPLRLLFLGRLDVEQKGLDVLIEAIARQPATHATIVGSDYRNSKAWLTNAIRQRAMQERVKILDPVFSLKERRALYATHHVFVHLSRWEGIPFACLEAAAAGMPLLISPDTNLAGEVLNWRSGWVVESVNDEQVVEKLQLILSEDGLEERRERATAMIEGSFLWSAITPRVIDAYASLLE